MKAIAETAKQLSEFRNRLNFANFDSLPPVDLKQGTEVVCNGFPGVVVRHYHSSIYEIRVPGGLVATSEFELVTE